MSEQKNPHSLTVWESTKDEAALVATGCVLGCAVGVGGGYIVSQAAGTPLVPSMVIGGAAGTLVGGGVAAYAAHRMHESRADAALYADAAIQDAMQAGRARSVSERRNSNIQKAIASGMKDALEGVNFPSADEIADAIGDKFEAILPDQRGNGGNVHAAP